jgi:mono/diheme cytochrome c family protein
MRLCLARAGRLVVLALTPWVSGCASSAGSCPNDPAPACPSVMPTYAADVAPIVQAVCVSCHGPGGTEAVKPFTTYDELNADKLAAYGRVLSCAMPPANAPQPLGLDQRQTLLEWFACGARP